MDQPPEDIISLDDGWKHVKETGVEPFVDFVETGQSDFFKAAEFVKLYDLIFQMCIQREPHNWSKDMYDRYTESNRNYLISHVAPKLDEAKSVATQHERSFLASWNKCWKNEKTIVNGLSKCFMYLDRFYVESNDGILPLKEQGFKLYKEEIFDHFVVQARDAIVHCIAAERDGEEQDADMLRDAVNVFVELGYNYGDSKLRVYQSDLEQHVTSHAGQFYKLKSRTWLDEDSCPNYLEKAERMLNDERDRVERYLNQASMNPLHDACYRELLKVHQTELLEKKTGLVHMLEQKRMDDLSRLYRLFQNYPQDLEPIGKVFNNFVRDKGSEVVDSAQPQSDEKKKKQTKAAATATEAKGNAKGNAKGKSSDPAAAEQSLVQNLIDLHDHFSKITRQCFGDHAVFQRALKKAFEDFINRDYRVSRLLARYVNDVLKKNSKIEQKDVNNTLENVVFLYGYIQDKDVFEYQYQNLLASRLLMNLCKSEHTEKSMLAKLKREAGYMWVGKLEGMFKDVAISQKLMEKFRKWYDTESNLKLTFDVTVCKTGYWPSSKNNRGSRMPQDDSIKTACDKFERYYVNEHSGQKLQWRLDQGLAEVQVAFSKDVRRTLVVTTYMMMSLLVFNQAKLATYSEIAELTGVPKDDLHDHLMTLAHPKVGVLQKNPNTRNVSDTDKFRINPKYKPVLRKITIGLMKFNTTVVPEKDPPERQHQIDAAIVRLMKTRHRMKHNDLVAEVVQQLKARFTPKPSVIKRRIESLIDQEYLERDANERGWYNYLA
jgi:cullin 1